MDRPYDHFARALGAAVRSARRALEKTQEDLAYEADVSVRQVSEIENGGNPKLNTLWRIARTLEVPVDDLIAEARRSKR
ncbi:MAG: helix-turn-helix domain-containing protein [Acidiferrobacteraceae bacterium]